MIFNELLKTRRHENVQKRTRTHENVRKRMKANENVRFRVISASEKTYKSNTYRNAFVYKLSEKTRITI